MKAGVFENNTTLKRAGSIIFNTPDKGNIMISKQATIINKTGLHARPASDFVLKAKKFESKITIRNIDGNSEAVNAKSIIRLLAEGMGQGTKIEIVTEGPDEQQAADELVTLIESGFGE